MILGTDHGLGGRLHPDEDLAEHQHVAVVTQVFADRVDVGRPPDVVTTSDNRVVLGAGGNQAARALATVLAMMADPSLAEDLPTEATLDRAAAAAE